ncbi:hypothetical protein N657DRAFT_675692 [Parathielavia appendiculata]|uniref:BZIP domain-containing protein n=1 Tax=Parathielavia appendiculata TaxID=2587402 RepID=A0AAN6TPF7_9PEZI|nr:hypothetical protein N657DRAFT_675692 [Parathielavia appendiculata]
MGSVGEKKQDASSAARIRDNQRRSRARRRELVEELKARVREYERQGVQATVEMRQAARRVAIENSRLRALLSSHGVTGEQVDHYLASFNDQPSSEAEPTVALAPRPQETGALHAPLPRLDGIHANGRASYGDESASSPYGAEPVTATSQRSPNASSMSQASPADDNTVVEIPASDYYSPNKAPISALDTLAVVADASIRQTCCGPTTQYTPADDRDVRKYAPIRAEPAPCSSNGGDGCDSASPLQLPTPGSINSHPTTTTRGSHFEMSCTAAAHIMASISRDGSEEKAREAMGCSGSEECLVKNTVLFQLLDSLGAL